MPDIQDELDEISSRSCGRCGKDIWEDDDAQYGNPQVGNVCHECWHVLNPNDFCLVCAEGGA